MNSNDYFVFCVGNIIEKTQNEGMGGVDRQKLEQALTAKQETEAKFSNLETRNKELIMEVADLKAKVSEI